MPKEKSAILKKKSPAEKSSLLIAEDDVTMCSFLADYLGSKGYQLVVATDGQEAIDALAENQFDLAII
ncbi:MAG: hypothetical protein PHE15_06250, partial [Dehalococcoidales bacterium]|nr:hypothetical protein [Dehalococcoidales bacterium]